MFQRRKKTCNLNFKPRTSRHNLRHIGHFRKYTQHLQQWKNERAERKEAETGHWTSQ
jgi:hypothetical protein